MDCVNEVLLVGHLGTDPERLENTENGVRFRIATNKRRFSKAVNDYVVDTEWHNIKAWNQNAQYTLEHIQKGDYVLIKGEIHYHSYKDDNGKYGRNAEIIASRVTKLNRSKNDLDD